MFLVLCNCNQTFRNSCIYSVEAMPFSERKLVYNLFCTIMQLNNVIACFWNFRKMIFENDYDSAKENIKDRNYIGSLLQTL